MQLYSQEFLEFFQADDKQKSVAYAMNLLENELVDVVTLYEQILTPALIDMTCKIDEKRYCIWKEHTRTSIIRTIVECCYPYIMKALNNRSEIECLGNVIVFCPAEEYHDIGAKMVADFFTLCGYNAIFLGGNTPRSDLADSLDFFEPKYIAISVTNYYNLVTAAKTIQELKQRKPNGAEVLVGGQAFDKNPNAFREIGANRLLHTFKDIKALSEVVRG